MVFVSSLFFCNALLIVVEELIKKKEVGDEIEVFWGAIKEREEIFK